MRVMTTKSAYDIRQDDERDGVERFCLAFVSDAIVIHPSSRGVVTRVAWPSGRSDKN